MFCGVQYLLPVKKNNINFVVALQKHNFAHKLNISEVVSREREKKLRECLYAKIMKL